MARTRPRGVTQSVCVLLLVLIAFLCVFGEPIWGDRAETIDAANAFGPASGEHWWGTDELGRDVFARVVASTRSRSAGPARRGHRRRRRRARGRRPAVLGPFLRRLLNALITVSLAFPGLLLALLVNTVSASGHRCRARRGYRPDPAVRPVRSDPRCVGGGVQVRRCGPGARRRPAPDHAPPHPAQRRQAADAHRPVGLGTSLVSISALSFLGLGVQPPSYDWGGCSDRAARTSTSTRWRRSAGRSRSCSPGWRSACRRGRSPTSGPGRLLPAIAGHRPGGAR